MDQADRVKAFRSYDFDGDQAWQEYLRKVEIPSNSPSDLLRVKAKWYKREKDPDLDVALASASAASSQQQQQQQQQQQHQPRQPQPRPQPQPACRGGGAGAGVGNLPPWVGQALFAADVAIIVLTVVYMLPLFPALSGRAYRLAVALCLAANLAHLSMQHGGLPLNMQGLQQWAVRALPSTHFAYAITALMFLTAPPVSALLPPYVIAAAYSASSHAAAHHRGHPLWRSHGARLHAYLTANREAALHLASQLEIALGFNMLVSLLFPRSRQLILTLFVWQQLRQRYWGPETGLYHRAAWAAIDAATAQLRAALPALEKVIAFVRRWFESGNPMLRAAR